MDEHSLFIELLEIDDPQQRQQRLLQRVGDDDAMRSRIEGLLEAHGRASQFMEESAVIDRAALDGPEVSNVLIERPGDTIGPYKLLQQIGEGGMGFVYMAEQTQPVSRKVALKIVKAGMDSRQVIARFEAERQALAMMNHPNIAKVLDAGATETGRPYFVMELVRGVPITEYCDSQKLNLHERMELFVKVCQAVHHAHQKGVIHRDLKPSNLLVELHDVHAVPKVIDFGIAKATDQKLTDKTLFTNFAQMIGTPMYMSPEQAQMSGLDVDVRSDIYSLGVLLYELLTGTTPVSKETLNQVDYDELRRMISEQDVPRASGRISTLKAEAKSTLATNRRSDVHRIHRMVRGEMDWVIAKSLEKDRTRRYQSATEFADDVQRFLDGEPVEAHPPSVFYRARKLAKRYRGLVTAASLLILMLIAATAVSMRYAYKATEASQTAETRRQEAVREREAAKVARLEAEEGRRLAITEQEKAEEHRNEAQRLQQLADQQREEIRRNLYIADMRLAAVDLDRQNVNGTKKKLREHHAEAAEAEYASWEWHFLLGQCHNQLATIPSPGYPWAGHVSNEHGELYAVAKDASIYRIEFDTPSTTTATKILDGDYFVWNLGWDHKRRRLVRPFGPDGVAFTDVSDGSQFILRDQDHDDLEPLAISPSGDYLLTKSGPPRETRLQVWNVSDREITIEYQLGDTPKPTRASWHPDETQFAIDSDYYPSGILVFDFSEPEPIAHHLDGETIRSLAYTSDGQQLIAGSPYGALFVIDAASGRIVFEGRHETGISTLALSANGNRLATAGFDTIVGVWETESWTRVTSLRGHDLIIQDVDWSPDGRFVVGCDESSLLIWDVDQVSSSVSLDTPSAAYASLQWFSEDGIGIAANDGRRWLISTDSNRKTEELTHAPRGYEPVGNILAKELTDIFEFSWWDQENPVPDRGVSDLQPFVISPNRDYLAIKTVDVSDETASITERPNRISVLDADSRSTVLECLYPAATSVFSFSPTEPRLASAGASRLEDSTGQGSDRHGQLVLFNLESGETRGYTVGNTDTQTSAMSWSRDGTKIAIGNRHGEVNVFVVGTESVAFDRKSMNDNVNALSWSDDGKRIACGDRSGLVILIDSDTGEEVMEVFDGEAEVLDLRFSPSGRKLAAYFADGEIRIWDAGSGYRYAESDEFRITMLRQQVDQRVGAKDYAGAVPFLRELLQLQPDNRDLISQLLRCHAQLKDTESLAMDYREFFETLENPSSAERYWLALTQIANGQSKAYASTCQSIVGDYGPEDADHDQMWAVWTPVLAPNALDDYTKAVEIAHGLVEQHPNESRYQQYQGAILLRAGRPAEAVTHLAGVVDAAVNSSSPTYGMYFLSMAYHELGDVEQARRWLERANEKAEKELAANSVLWNRKLTLELFREEATEKVGEPVASAAE